jgi:hypothetical protein
LQTQPTKHGFIAIYRWQVEAEYEEQFRYRWHDLTLKGRDFGAYGSCLTIDETGNFVAIALWPDEEARAKAFAKIDAGPPLKGVHRLSEERLQVEDDLWIASPFVKLTP